MGIGKILVGIGGGIALGPVGVAAGILIGDSKPAQKAAEITTKFISGVGEVTVSAGTTILDAVSDVSKAFIALVGDLFGAIALRPLRPSEIAIAKQVYYNRVCLPLDRIVVCSLNGWGQRPFTMPGGMLSTLGFAIPGIGPLLAVSSIIGDLTDKYILFLGRDGYRDANWKRNGDLVAGQTLIHELTHAWQGYHNRFAWSYIFGSLSSQAQDGKDAYKYVPGAQFRTYNPEQQAHIVEDWFVECNNPKNPLAKNGGPNLRHYMTCNIWPGLPDAETIFPPQSPGEMLLRAKQIEEVGRALIARSGNGSIPALLPLFYQGNQLLAQARAIRDPAKSKAMQWSVPIQAGAVG